MLDIFLRKKVVKGLMFAVKKEEVVLKGQKCNDVILKRPLVDIKKIWNLDKFAS